MTQNENSKKMSRRNFLKTTGTIAGGAALLGLTVGPQLFQSSNTKSIPPIVEAQTTESTTTSTATTGYVPKTRRYYLYSTDGIINVPDETLGHRPVYIFGFAKPMSDTRRIGSGTALSLDPTAPNYAFSDLNWLTTSDQKPLMLGKASLPAPPIWGVEGDILEITLFNLGFKYFDAPDPHTIHLHGAHAPTYYDGIPELSFGVPMWMGAPLNTLDDVKMFSFTYKMKCERPGTYMYHCHVEASEHVQMGMYGPLWIYPKERGFTWISSVARGGWTYGNTLTRFSQEAILLFSEIDTRWHDGIFLPPGAPTPDPDVIANFNPIDYTPNYWLVNGRSFPDTVMPGKYTQGYQTGTATITDDLLTYYPAEAVTGAPVTPISVPRQPVPTYVQTGVPQKVLARLSNMGYQAQPLHFHGVMPTIVGKDTHAWVPTSNAMFSTPQDERRRIFTQGIFSGETYDLISSYPDKAQISSIYSSVLSASNPNPFPPFGAEWGTILPTVDPTIPATAGILHDAYPLLYLWHIHDDYKVTNNGVYPGGAVVLVKVNKTAPTSTKSIIQYLIDA
jgi:hypothetical protein